jgi:hypothetical protein
METFLMKTVPSYETVVEMDQKIRKYMLSTPFSTYPSGIPENGFYSPRAFMQRNLVPYFSRTSEPTRYRSTMDAHLLFDTSVIIHTHQLLHGSYEG